MGNLFSKCCKKKEEKRYVNNERDKAAQPEQEDPSVCVVTHNETKTEKAVSGYIKEENEAVAEEKEKIDETDKAEHRKHRRHKSTESDESSDDSTSSCSDSSDSDSDVGQMKVYKNKGGGTTYVSKKTIIAGNKITIGKDASNVTINIGSKNTAPDVQQRSPSTSGQYQEKPFQSYYSDVKAKEEERRQYASRWGPGTGPPGGNFIDTRESNVNEYVFESSVRVDAARWVCLIVSPDGRTGTGFRVGTKYIMTAKHVLDMILESSYQPVGQPAQNGLQDPCAYAVFNFTKDGPISGRQKFHFKGTVHFSDAATDSAVLELEDSIHGAPMPFSFTFFSLPRLNNRFSLIGHPAGKRMQINHVDKIIDMTSVDTQRDIVAVKHESRQHLGREYEFPPHNVLANPHRYLFHCKFSKGASGSPGVVVLDDGRVVVVTMLVCGLPDWYYDPSVPDNVKNSWPKMYCVEQGANFKSIYEHMLRDNPRLCSEIFFSHTDTIPNPTI